MFPTGDNCYKAAVDAYLESLRNLKPSNKTWWTDVEGRSMVLATDSTMVHRLKMNSYLVRRKIPEYKFVAEVVAYDDGSFQTAAFVNGIMHQRRRSS